MLHEGIECLYTRGWVPDSGMLRYTLAQEIRTEGLRDKMHGAFNASEDAVIIHSYVGESETGDVFECDAAGEDKYGWMLENVDKATMALIPLNGD